MRYGELRVYDGVESIDGKEVRIIIAATSRSAAVAALAKFGVGISVRRLMTYWTQSRERIICEIALSEPGQAFGQRPDRAFFPLPPRAISAPPPPEPKMPTDPEGMRKYQRKIRENSDEGKRARGERRVSTWIPKEAAEALDRLTGGSTAKGAVQAALIQAILAAAAPQPATKRKAA